MFKTAMILIAVLVSISYAHMNSNANGELLTEFLTIHQEIPVDGQFDRPVDIALDKNDNLYVLDAGNSRIQVFDENSNFISKFSYKGIDDKQHTNIISISVGDNGRIYLADSTNKIIRVFDNSGEHLFDFGKSIFDNLESSHMSISVDDDEEKIYVLSNRQDFFVFDISGKLLFRFGEKYESYVVGFDFLVNDKKIYSLQPGNKGINVFDISGKFLFTFGDEGNGMLDKPSTLAADKQNRIFVGDIHTGKIKIFTSDGKYLSSFNYVDVKEEFILTRSMEIDSTGRIYLSSWMDNTIRIYENNEHAYNIGNKNFFDGLLGDPKDVEVDNKNGRIFVVNGVHDVKVFDNKGKYLFDIEETNIDEEKFLLHPDHIFIDKEGRIIIGHDGGIDVLDNNLKPLYSFADKKSVGSGGFIKGDVAVDKNGRIFVADITNNVIKIYDRTNRSGIDFELKGPGIYENSRISALIIDKDNKIYVGIAGKIHVFDIDGNHLSSFGDVRPSDIAINNKGWLFVAEGEKGRVQVFDEKQKYVFSFGKSFGVTDLISPRGITIDENNRIYVVDWPSKAVRGFLLDEELLEPTHSWKQNKIDAPKISTILQQDIIGAISKDGQFEGPTDIKIGKFNKIVVLDSAGHKIQVFDKKTGKHFFSFGEQGNENGEFNHPTKIDVGNDGKIYVMDGSDSGGNNNRVQVFDKDGAHLFNILDETTEISRFHYFGGIAVDDENKVFIVGYYAIHVFDDSGDYLFSFGKAGSKDGGSGDLRGITIDEKGRVYVAHMHEYIQVFDNNGQYLWNFKEKGMDNVEFGKISGRDIEIDESKDGQINVLDHSNHKMLIFDNTGKHLFTTQEKFSENKFGQFALDEEGHMYSVDYKNKKIHVFDTDSKKYLWSFGEKGDSYKHFTYPFRIDVDDKGQIYVIDNKQWRIQKFSNTYELLSTYELILSDQEKKEQDYPELVGITVDKNEQVFAIDANNNIRVFDSNLKLLQIIEDKNKSDERPHSYSRDITHGKNGELYILDSGKGHIKVINEKGEKLFEFGEISVTDSTISNYHPSRVKVDTNGQIYIIDQQNYTVLVFDNKGNLMFTFGTKTIHDEVVNMPSELAVDKDGQIYVIEYKHSQY